MAEVRILNQDSEKKDQDQDTESGSGSRSRIRIGIQNQDRDPGSGSGIRNLNQDLGTFRCWPLPIGEAVFLACGAWFYLEMSWIDL